MWKLTNTQLSTPASFVHKKQSHKTYYADRTNSVENVTHIVPTIKKLSKLSFSPINKFLYKSLDVSITLTGVNDYTPVFLFDATTENSFTSLEDVYQSSLLDSVYINHEPEDLYLYTDYAITNITSQVNLAIFLQNPGLEKITVQRTAFSAKQSVTAEFFRQLSLQLDSTVTFSYKNKVYDASTDALYPILNNQIRIHTRPLYVFEHTFSNYDEIDVVIYKDRAYKKALTTEIDLTQQLFLINGTHVCVLVIED